MRGVGTLGCVCVCIGVGVGVADSPSARLERHLNLVNLESCNR